MASIRSKVEKLTRNREQGTLHHQQCIDELSIQFDARNIRAKGSIDDSKVVSPTRSETPTSFVTVIEVKDPTPQPRQTSPPPAPASTPITGTASATSTTSISIADNSCTADDIKPEPSYSPPQLPQKYETTDEDNQSAPVKCDNSSAQIANPVVEVKRKIPPRLVFFRAFFSSPARNKAKWTRKGGQDAS